MNSSFIKYVSADIRNHRGDHDLLAFLRREFFLALSKKIFFGEMCMLRWLCDHTGRDRVQNNDICERLGVTPVEG
jgi:hypothetical protein